ncbi:DUF5686 and carboxypeptidase-like regulatory domain-containing protein [Solitalea koreensis]|uniref:CarboxypepD_reg-like domain-containing protein n=1 Tax=Solitalea koreensis TaxID=543615 RepID=A0A521C9B9_9SPHI|nr:DUF5686 and carboxypeptidase-like regulatory domain-containing protein [Solitalea koreensis]SMO55988.1 CarboxypepD_reg-like domain-containing protein [Solitalea koreensis]
MFTYKPYLYLAILCALLSMAYTSVAQTTVVSGKVIDAVSREALSTVSIKFINSNKGTVTDSNGRYFLSTTDKVTLIQFSYLSYQTVTKRITPGAQQVLNVQLVTNNQTLPEAEIRATRRVKYKNKDNPAVALIKKVIDNKSINQPKNYSSLEYEKYEKLVFSLSDLPQKTLDKKLLASYKFLWENKDTTKIPGKTLYPIYMEEMVSDHYYNKELNKSKTIIKAKQQVDISNYVDQNGVSIYLNRVYADIDIYANNIFIVTNQFLSPIADNAQDYYKFFITDTVVNDTSKLVEISFTPRVKGDLLFEGKLYITLDGKFAVKRLDMGLDKNVNLNWIRSLHVIQTFDQDSLGHYYLNSSDALTDLGFLRNKGVGVVGERSMSFKNYVINHPKEASFYSDDTVNTNTEELKQNEAYWKQNRAIALSHSESNVYKNMDTLQSIPKFKRTANFVNFLVTGYHGFGGFEMGPSSTFFSFNELEGSRFKFGGRTLPKFYNPWYFEGYAAYGTKDEKWKYKLATTYSLNHKTIYKFPNNYLKVSYERTTMIPGQELELAQSDGFLLSFKRGEDNKWLYTENYKFNYLREFKDHFSYDWGFNRFTQSPALDLRYISTINGADTTISSLTTSELSLRLRWAPHEQMIQGKSYRTQIPNKFPIITAKYTMGIKGLFGGAYNYQAVEAGISKRTYLSQLGYTDIAIEGRIVLGQVPFPLLNLIPANQSYIYSRSSFNLMNFMEFVSDHSVNVFIDHSFGGFILNKVPLIKKLKWREFVAMKMAFGGLRSENDPAVHSNLYQFPANDNGTPTTYALEKPYMEVSLGIGNIFKLFRVDAIRRLTYLNNPGVAQNGIRIAYILDF